MKGASVMRIRFGLALLILLGACLLVGCKRTAEIPMATVVLCFSTDETECFARGVFEFPCSGFGNETRVVGIWKIVFTEQALVSEERAIKEFLMRIAGYALKGEPPIYYGDLFALIYEGTLHLKFVANERERADFTLSGFVPMSGQPLGEWWFGAFDGGYRGGSVRLELMDLGECDGAGAADPNTED